MLKVILPVLGVSYVEHNPINKLLSCGDDYLHMLVEVLTIHAELCTFLRRKYKMFRIYASSYSHESGFHTCEAHPHVSVRMHASETPNTTSFLRDSKIS